MALFRRQKKESVLPEIDKYYEGEKRDRAGMAWLLAIVSVLIVALFLVVVFLIGRWAYRSITNNNDGDVAVTTTDKDGGELPSFDGNSGSQGKTESNDQPAANNESDQSTNNSGQNENNGAEGTVEAPAQTEQNQSSATAPTPPSTTIPSTGDGPLPSTGPAENMIVVFLLAAIAAGTLHYSVSNRKN